MIENVAVSPTVASDGTLPVIEFMAPALGASYGGPAPVTEYVAPFLGAFDDGPAPDIDDITRYLNDLKKQGICHPMLLSLESRVAALGQA